MVADPQGIECQGGVILGVWLQVKTCQPVRRSDVAFHRVRTQVRSSSPSPPGARARMFRRSKTAGKLLAALIRPHARPYPPP